MARSPLKDALRLRRLLETVMAETCKMHDLTGECHACEKRIQALYGSLWDNRKMVRSALRRRK